MHSSTQEPPAGVGFWRSHKLLVIMDFWSADGGTVMLDTCIYAHKKIEKGGESTKNNRKQNNIGVKQEAGPEFVDCSCMKVVEREYERK